jgi:predicted Fe-Mo cluster-binding NifX family protein
MKVCIPVNRAHGLESRVHEHFGSAPVLLIVETESMKVEVLQNQNHRHKHGKCNPVASLTGKSIDTVIVGGIGGQALERLNQNGIAVYKSEPGIVANAITALKDNRLAEIAPGDLCGDRNLDGHQCSN